MCLTFKHGSFSIAKLQEILQDPISCLRIKLQYQRSMEFGHFALFENHISLRFFVHYISHASIVYIYIYQTTASISGKFSNGQQFRISPVVYPTNCCCSCCCSCCSCFKISSQAVVGYLNYPLEWTAEKLPFRMTIPDPIDPRTQSP